VEIVKRLEAGDTKMADRYGRKVADGKLVFDLEPGQDVLVREYIPGKMRLRATGPFKFLRVIKGSGAEVINRKGRIMRVAMANLKPYRPPVTGERLVVSEVPKPKQRSVAMFDSSSEDDWATEGSDDEQ
jgi:hypothetical protein